MIDERRISIESDGLRLEAAAHEDAGALAALVLHPHPQYGGDMDNHVVKSLCDVLASRGATTLRFNFRGAGSSEGTYAGGRGEASDVRAATATLRELRPHAQFVLAGYSFGAMVAASVAADVIPNALILISPPVGTVEPTALDATLPTLLVTGANDHVAPPPALRALEAPSRTVVVVPDADHGWWLGVDQLSAAVTAFVEATLGAPAAG